MKAFAEHNVEVTYGRSKPRIKLFLAAATIFLLVTTIVFIALFVHYYIKFDKHEPPTDDPIFTTPVCVLTEPPTDGTICTTPVCVSTAALMLKNMNLSVDPCVDFNEFACGRFNREAPFIEGFTIARKMIDQVLQENVLVMKDIIKEDITPGQPKYLQKMKLFYKSCMDTGTIEDTSLETILSDTFREDWPTVNTAWSNRTFNLNDLIIRYSREYTEHLFAITVCPHVIENTRNTICCFSNLLMVINTDITKSQAFTFSYSRDATKPDITLLVFCTDLAISAKLKSPKTLSLSQEVLSEAAIVFGANRTTAEQDAKEFLELEEALFKTPNVSGDTQQLNVSEPATLITLGKISEQYPWIDLPGAMRAIFETVNITLSDDDDIHVDDTQYMEHLKSALKLFSSRAIQNYFGFTYALPRVEDMRYRLRCKADIDTPRWMTCLHKSLTYFLKAMSKQFVDRKFSNDTKVSVGKMIDNLKEAFKQMLGEITWMESSTKTAALKKLAAMTNMIGYPDTGFTDEDINQEYEQFDMNATTYYRNERLIHALIHKKVLASLRKPVDKTRRNLTPLDVSAEYRLSQNSMIYPAAFLQPPNISPTYPDALNYGSLGAIIGHEITHAYDNHGSYFDDKGNLSDWWQPSDKKIFLDKVQCIVDQASNFTFDEVNMTLNGERVQGEAIADNGGLRESYRAYKALVAEKREDNILPGLKLNYDQLFFLAFAQNWCQRTTPEGLNEILNDVHPPGRFRIIGTLQNSEEFAKAFNCPSGSYMNPVKKCRVW